MKLVDTNVLLYAVDERSQFHVSARSWLTQALNGSETVAFPWVSLLGFVRLITNPRLTTQALTIDQAEEVVTAWLAPPNAIALEAGRGHISELFSLLRQAGTAGNLPTDAHIAALAIQHRGSVVTFDRDFRRFGVKVVVPS